MNDGRSALTQALILTRPTDASVEPNLPIGKLLERITNQRKKTKPQKVHHRLFSSVDSFVRSLSEPPFPFFSSLLLLLKKLCQGRYVSCLLRSMPKRHRCLLLCAWLFAVTRCQLRWIKTAINRMGTKTIVADPHTILTHTHTHRYIDTLSLPAFLTKPFTAAAPS